METISYHLETFDGPLDLLLALIHKNKVDVTDIPISLICDQYLAYIGHAQAADMEIASDFIVMASELMLIKSKMLLPRTDPTEKDPRAELSDALIKYQAAKAASVQLAARYAQYSARMEKDTDEISIDKTFCADQKPEALVQAVTRILSVRDLKPVAEKSTFTPMIASPIIPVEEKIVGILSHFRSDRPDDTVSMQQLLDDATDTPNLVAIFLGVLELMRVKQLVIADDCPDTGVLSCRDISFTARMSPDRDGGSGIPEAGGQLSLFD